MASFVGGPKNAYHLLLTMLLLPLATKKSVKSCLPGLPFVSAESSITIRMGMIQPLNGSYGFQQTASASTMAIDDIHQMGLLSNVTIQITYANGNCNPKTAFGVALSLRNQQHVDGYFGMPCSQAALNAGRLVAAWNLPHWSFASSDPLLSNKTTYNTLWTRVLMIMGPILDSWCNSILQYAQLFFPESNITITQIYRPTSTFASDFELLSWMKKIQETTRIVIICGEDPLIRRIMLTAHYHGMTSGDYVFITPTILPPDNLNTRWFVVNATDNDIALEAFRSLLQIGVAELDQNTSVNLRQMVPYKLAEPPWNYNVSLLQGIRGSAYALFVYDTVYMYCLTLSQVLSQNRDYRNGTLMRDVAKSISFYGKTGLVKLDDNADRIGDYQVWHLNASVNATSYQPLLYIINTSPTNNTDRVHTISQRYWGITGFQVPPDRPACGFFNELCPPESSLSALAVAGIATVCCVLIITTAVGYVVHRRQKREENLKRMTWKVNADDICYINIDSKAERTSLSRSLLAKSNSNMVQLHMSDHRANARRGTNPISDNSTVSGDNDVNSVTLPAASTITCRTALFKGNFAVCVKEIRRDGNFQLSAEQQEELMNMREVSCENLNEFYGVCVELGRILILTKYCDKGSLHDIISDDTTTLDDTFKFSLITDLVKGMEYLHQSVLKCHGRLKSTNCLVDSHWTLKVTDWGLDSIRYNTQPFNLQHNVAASLWTAPEHLRKVGQVPLEINRSQPGDVYSFAIILHEICFNCSPFRVEEDSGIDPEEIVNRVRACDGPPFRPKLPNPEQRNIPQLFSCGGGILKTTMIGCWSEDPAARPSFSNVRYWFANNIELRKQFPSKHGNLMDHVLTMMEKHANNLELLIAERNRLLVDEKKKTDQLLCRMMPPTVAESLKSGYPVAPELFPDATIYFSDVLTFATLVGERSPLEVVTFLNELWTLFDDTIAQFDVYKVETIGDAYMVACGLPNYNSRHASIIVDMSLAILRAVRTFHVTSRPTSGSDGPHVNELDNKPLPVRIGLNSGPVVAGVIGRTMPRYCLFGDTVNVASRMESTGQGFRIHMSESTYRELIANGSVYNVQPRGLIEVKVSMRSAAHYM